LRKFVRACFVLVLFSVFHQPLPAAETVMVMMNTSAGEITLELYPEAAPLTVANFLRYVDGHYYDNAHFYRTVRMDNQAQNKIWIEVIQGGRGMEVTDSPFEPIAHETTEATGILHRDGVISMARGEPGSAASEFFICIKDQPELDFGGRRNPDGLGFAAFGRVVAGMEVVREIQNMKTVPPAGPELQYTSGQILADPVLISNISRLESAPAKPASEAILQELDLFWAELAQTVADGDFEGYKATYHPDAVLVSESSRTSSPISQAFAGWEQGFADTRAGKIHASVEFRFTRRFNDATTAHETGIFHYAMEDENGARKDSYAHFEALLVKKERWKTIMEYQKSPASPTEWHGNLGSE
jgi:peptidyl-prolyl cis-trans isomerase A (cyclophilin A)